MRGRKLSAVKLSPNMIDGTFVARVNRFAALVQVDGHETLVHVANSGRLRELFQEGMQVLLTPVDGAASRKTRYDLTLVDLGHTLVSADARLPNAIVYEAIKSGQVAELLGYSDVLREQALEESRIDLLLLRDDTRCYVEVKSATLVQDSVALFPDAPTARGRRHLETLVHAVRQGWGGVVVFVVQREDAQSFAPHDAADPDFGKALRHAHREGVKVYAYGCRVTRQEITLAQRLPVLL